MISLFVCFILSVPMANGQGEAVNPFDLLNRIGAENLLVTKDSSSRGTIYKRRSDNPFEQYRGDVRSAAQVAAEQHAKPRVNRILQPELPTPKVPKKYSASFLFGLLLGVLILLAFTSTVYRYYIDKIFRAFFNQNILTHLHREHGGPNLIPFLMLYAIFIVVAGVFVYLSIAYFGGGTPLAPTWRWVLYCIGGVMAIVLAKHATIGFLALVSPAWRELRFYNFNIAIFHQVIGLTLLPLVLALAFAPSNLTSALIYIGLALMVLAYLFLYFRGLLIGSKYLVFNKFHFFVYLCTVEIAPAFILAKLAILAQNV